ncbi:YegP family protein [Kribbella sp. NPDC000426]|uniref:YegP family protein n=1 Tax=Kribbella sp. NPDC000426 TaxID=3154255 RepID=UPI00332084BD
MAGKFELYKDKSGEFRFRLKAGNGEVIATSSESYTTKAAAQNGIDSVKRNAGDANVDDQTD